MNVAGLRAPYSLIFSLFALAALVVDRSAAAEPKAPDRVLRAGAVALNIDPPAFPVLVNGHFNERTAHGVDQPLYARALVLDDGQRRIAIVIVDSCMMPRELLDRVKTQAHGRTGIPTERMLIAATHTHSAPSAMGLLGCRADEAYARFLEAQLVRALDEANRKLQPARVGWAVVEDREHTYCRQGIYRTDRVGVDPFGTQTVRANMHPGYQNPDVVGPTGPVDAGLSVLSVQTSDGRPLAVLANYSMHYFGSEPVSSDYFGLFVDHLTRLVAPSGKDSFVGIMSQGTSGDQMWMDYSRPQERVAMDAYARAVAERAYGALQKVKHVDWAPLAMAEKTLSLRRRTPDNKRLQWARSVLKRPTDPALHAFATVYAQEQLFILAEPERELKLQAVRIGELGITAMPNEVFGITGLKIKLQSPLAATFNIALANGGEGYIPPPEQHKFGGYTSWPARSAGLEVQAEPKIVEGVLGLLEEVSGKPRRELKASDGAYAQAVRHDRPVAYWRLEDIAGTKAADASGNHREADYEDLIALYLDGPQGAGLSGEGANRAVHLAGGRLARSIKNLAADYSVEFWFWNGLPNDARKITADLFSRSGDGAGPNDRLGIAGAGEQAGRLFFAGGDKSPQAVGKSKLATKTWYHVALVRAGDKVAVYLNGRAEPEIAAQSPPPQGSQLFFGGSYQNAANLEGKLDEVSVYARPLTAAEIAKHYAAAAVEPGSDGKASK